MTSKYKGVIWHQGKWRAMIRAGEPLPNGKARQIWLGGYDVEEDAARAYDAAALKYFGEFAALNLGEHPEAQVFGAVEKAEA